MKWWNIWVSFSFQGSSLRKWRANREVTDGLVITCGNNWRLTHWVSCEDVPAFRSRLFTSNICTSVWKVVNRNAMISFMEMKQHVLFINLYLVIHSLSADISIAFLDGNLRQGVNVKRWLGQPNWEKYFSLRSAQNKNYFENISRRRSSDKQAPSSRISHDERDSEWPSHNWL